MHQNASYAAVSSQYDGLNLDCDNLLLGTYRVAAHPATGSLTLRLFEARVYRAG